MNNPLEHSNSEAFKQDASRGEPKDAKAAYVAKQVQDVKDSVAKCNADTERVNLMRQVSEDRQNGTNSKTQEEDHDYYNGMSQ